MMWELLFLLLPLAALSGWIVGRRRFLTPHNLEKLLGLSELIRRPSPKPAEMFVKWLDENQESIETHLFLGNTFRRRGEVDKAIGIHQNLMMQAHLTDEQRALSLLELSRDYMRAGVLDRAENLLKELVSKGRELEASYQHLIEIYQQSKDWVRAIETADKLQQTTGRDMSRHIAHFYCELAEQRWLKGEREIAEDYLKQAIAKNPESVRASLLMGDIQAQSGHFKGAIKTYQKVQKQDQAFLSEIVFPLARCYDSLGNHQGMVKYLTQCMQTNPSLSVALAFSDWLYKTHGEEEALKFVVEHLRVHPTIRGLNHLLKCTLARAEGSVHADLEILQELMEKILANKPLYRCQSCGFSARTLQWQCPGCKRWDVIKPIPE